MVFVAAFESSESPDIESKLRNLLDKHGAYGERLLDGSRVLTMAVHLNVTDQALAAARIALGIRRFVTRARSAICTGRTLSEAPLGVGVLLELGASLLNKTPPDTVYLDETSASLLETRFELADQAGTCQLIVERPEGEAPRTLQGRVSPFVGRRAELDRLEATFRECCEESCARVVLVTAPAGGGKSRLRHELIARLNRSSLAFCNLLGRGDSVRSNAPFGVLAPALRSWAELASADTPEGKREQLRQRVRELVPGEAAELMAALLGEMLGLPFPDASSPELAAVRRDAQLMADRTLASFLTWIDALCRRQPVLFVLEDLHWADQASVRFLDAALRNTRELPFMVLAFARDEVRRLFPNLWSGRELVDIRLAKLGAKSTEQLIDSLTKDLDAAVRKWIVERADGNPFFVEELVRSVSPGVAQHNVPDSIIGILQARLDALGTDAKAVIRAGSVFGRSFKESAVRSLLEAQLERATIAGSLQQLVDGEVISSRAASADREYVFGHALIRDAAYALLPEVEKSLGHQLAGEWLETQEGIESSTLAEHFELGGQLLRAAPHYCAAASKALATSWLEEVVRCGERAISCGAEGELLARVHAELAEAISVFGDEERALAYAELALAGLRETTDEWWRAAQVAGLMCARRDLPALNRLIDRMLLRSAQPPLQPAQVVALAYVGGECFRLTHTELGTKLLDLLPHDAREGLQGRPFAITCYARAVRAVSEGNLSAAARYADAALESLRAVGAEREAAEVLSVKAYLLLQLGCFEEAESRFRELVEVGGRLALKRWVATADEELGLIRLDRGELEAGRAALARAREIYREVAYDWGVIATSTHLAHAQGMAGDLEGAATSAAELLSTTSDPALRAVLLAVLARIELMRGRAGDALQAVEAALELVRAHQLYERIAFIRAVHLESLAAKGRADEFRAAGAEASAWLLESAAKIDDEALRQSFLEKVPENAHLRKIIASGPR